ncbi:hypothetical protein HanRHA438_Chr03g0107591 [Helianthus annuus]|uniref:Uncharacterized protein n=1 Tax=Helianthus annuus TaxID=4232 RepID=A0A9K3JE59_HELAN|nr:hypothetical protein HanXRQr2_Chr03g0096511 [Helianthus annuus]KAJ0599481.1 hypothetical protein HanIR_Chr03g0105361 [Helianthus annuus]KAJ0607045.1 hypothetical protein HanHA89_Chr03g0091991 [Helianthus annuus]KAJ0772956.1 hypothetical protein HanOQP8_Chr03g0093371 [Helianthus annuus]KAJ0934451.1 hypothetical protein HanRHA438_Chr03g0107591 [Helianthus annuus]
MNFELGENFAFDQQLARDLIDNQSPIRPLPEHLLLLGRICHVWGRGDRDWPVIRRSGERDVMSLRDALKVPNFSDLDFEFDKLAEDEEPFLKHTSSSTQEIRPLADPKSSDAPVTETTSVGPRSYEKTDQALLHRPSGVAATDKGVSLDSGPKGLIRKQKIDVPQVWSSISLPIPKVIKKAKKATSYSGDNVLTDLTEHLSGGKSSREEAAKAQSAHSATFSGGYLSVDETEVMEIEEPAVTSKDEGKVQGDVKMVTFLGTILGSSLGPECFLDVEEDQVSSLPSSWFGPEVMAFFRYADVFSGEMEIYPAPAEEKFVPDWDVKNKDSVMDDLTARMYLFNINTPLDHSRSRRMKESRPGSRGASQPSSIECICS